MKKAIRCIREGVKLYWNGAYLDETPTWYDDKNKLYHSLWHGRNYFAVGGYEFRIVKPSKLRQAVDSLTEENAKLKERLRHLEEAWEQSTK